MRTTLDIDDDVLMAVKELARRESKSAGKIASSLIRSAIVGDGGQQNHQVNESGAKYGFKPFAKRGGIVTNKDIDKLREELGD